MIWGGKPTIFRNIHVYTCHTDWYRTILNSIVEFAPRNWRATGPPKTDGWKFGSPQAPPKNWFERWKKPRSPQKNAGFGKWILLKMPKNIQMWAIICSDWWFVNKCFGNVLDHFSWWLGNRGICRLQPKGIQVTPGYPPNPSSKQTWNELGEKGLSKVGETFSNSNIFWSFTPKKLGEDLYFHPFWLTLRHIFFKWVVPKTPPSSLGVC